MKTIKLFTLLLATMIMGSTSAQCDATFTSSNSGSGTFVFTNSGTYGGYYWDFGNGTSGSGQTVTNQYNANGAYEVCLTVYDSISQCTDTYCDSVLVTGLSGGSGATCDASFDAIADSVSCNAIYYGAHNSNYSNYYWDFGDGNTANNTWGVHTYAQDGTYTIGLVVMDTDSSGNVLCGDTTYQTVVINCNGSSATCNADFTLFQDSVNAGVYYAWNMSTGNNLSYYWDFGDGNSSTQAYPIHTYANVGNYNLCLTIDDGNGCTDTYCDIISVVVKANGTVLNVMAPGQAASVEDVNILEEVTLYPNPNNGQFNLSMDLSQQGEFTISVLNYVGQVIEMTSTGLNAGQNVLNMNIENQPKGVYIVNILDETTGSSRNIKLIKE